MTLLVGGSGPRGPAEAARARRQPSRRGACRSQARSGTCTDVLPCPAAIHRPERQQLLASPPRRCRVPWREPNARPSRRVAPDFRKMRCPMLTSVGRGIALRARRCRSRRDRRPAQPRTGTRHRDRQGPASTRCRIACSSQLPVTPYARRSEGRASRRTLAPAPGTGTAACLSTRGSWLPPCKCRSWMRPAAWRPA